MKVTVLVRKTFIFGSNPPIILILWVHSALLYHVSVESIGFHGGHVDKLKYPFLLSHMQHMSLNPFWLLFYCGSACNQSCAVADQAQMQKVAAAM